MSNTQAGLRKKSFELYYNGGSIWCEHLDGMGFLKDEVIEKFLNDSKVFSRPSMTSYMIINLDETYIDNDIVSCITGQIISLQKRFMKIAFVGVEKRKLRSEFRTIQAQTGCVVEFFADYEKSKQWVLP